MGIGNFFKFLIEGDSEYDDVENDDLYDDEEFEVGRDKERDRERDREREFEREAAPVREHKQPRGSRFGGGSKIVNIDPNSAQVQVVVLKPKTDAQVKEVAEYIKNKNAVVVNLEKIDKSRRGVVKAFISGVSYGLDGKESQIAECSYVFIPQSVGIVTENSGFDYGEDDLFGE